MIFALTLNLPALRSRVVDAQIKAKRAAGNLAKGGLKGILQKVAKFAGWAFGQLVRFFNLSFDRLWDIIVEGYFVLKTFDWNQTDEDLRKQIDSNNQAIAVAAANSLGTALGWGTVRLANFFIGRLFGKKTSKAAAKMKVPVLSARIGLALAEEGNEETKAAVYGFLKTATAAQISNQFINFMLSARRNEWFGLKSITSPQENGSIAAKIEKKIEQLPQFWRAPVEALIESFEEAIIEAGYVVAFTIDDHVAAARYARDSGIVRTVEVIPEKGSEEKLTFAAPMGRLKEEIEHTISGTYPLVKNRDIGLMIGTPLDEYVKAQPQTLRLIVDLYSVKAPPFYKKTDNFVWATVSISNVKRSALDWMTIKQAFGGANGYLWGRYRANVQFKSGRRMTYFVASEGEAKSRLDAFLRLTDDELTTLNITEEQKVGERVKKPKLVKNTTRIYPCFFTVINREELLDPQKGRVGTRQKNYRDNRAKIPLWTETEPDGTRDLIRRILTKGF